MGDVDGNESKRGDPQLPVALGLLRTRFTCRVCLHKPVTFLEGSAIVESVRVSVCACVSVLARTSTLYVHVGSLQARMFDELVWRSARQVVLKRSVDGSVECACPDVLPLF